MDLDLAKIATATVSGWVLVGPISRGMFFRMMTEGTT